MRDRKGWKALGYESFVEYGEKELNFGSTHLYQLAHAAEISLQIGYSAIAEKQPPESQLRPLSQVPEDERKAIWDEATSVKASKPWRWRWRWRWRIQRRNAGCTPS